MGVFSFPRVLAVSVNGASSEGLRLNIVSCTIVASPSPPPKVYSLVTVSEFTDNSKLKQIYHFLGFCFVCFFVTVELPFISLTATLYGQKKLLSFSFI